ncbi:hypothetical protein MMC15_003049 [Xylographa vitiligo]|nr:hypothetical protein [Xylographa vitiligo]
MKSSFLLLSSLLFATKLLAALHGLERRGSKEITFDQGSDNTGVGYSQNWAGAILDSPAGETFNYVHGTFTVPKSCPPPGSGDGSWGSAAWVGLGGANNEVLIQAIIVSTVNSSSGVTMESYSAFYEWIPAGATSVDLEVSAGDEIALTVSSNSDGTNGTIIIKNKSTGQNFHSVITMPAPDSYINGTTAEWIVEDYMVDTGFIPMADFETVNFKDCVAKTDSESFGIGNATATVMIGEVLGAVRMTANATIENSSSVQVTYFADGPVL